jgi:hypothetical protein
MRASLRGSSQEKLVAKKDIEEKCKVKVYQIWYISIDGPLGKWLGMSREERHKMTVNDFLMVVRAISEQGFYAREACGVFLHTVLFEESMKKTLHPNEMRTWKGRLGAVVPNFPPNVPLPIGAIEFFNEDRERIQKDTEIERSDQSRSSLLEGQMEGNYKRLADQSRCSMTPSFKRNDGGELEGIVAANPEEDDPDADPTGKKRKKTRKLVRNDTPLSNCSDDWFDAPKSLGGAASASSANAATGGRGIAKKPPAAIKKSSAGSSVPKARATIAKPKREATLKVESGIGKLTWRERTNKVRRLSACQINLGNAEQYIEQFASEDGFPKLKTEALAACTAKLSAQSTDQSLLLLLRDEGGSGISVDGIELREQWSLARTKLAAIDATISAVAEAEHADYKGCPSVVLKMCECVAGLVLVGVAVPALVNTKLMNAELKALLNLRDVGKVMRIFIEDDEDTAKAKVADALGIPEPGRNHMVVLPMYNFEMIAG